MRWIMVGWARRFAFLLAFLSLALPVEPAAGAERHGLAMYGEPKYGKEFRHFDYVNPDAPKAAP
jgi:microcin C transport system substrate-binding protein